MKVEDVKEITKKALAQGLGMTFQSESGEEGELEGENLIEWGKKVADLQNGVENFTGALMDVLAKIKFDTRRYSPDIPDIMIDSYEWGGFVEAIQYGLVQSIDSDPMWSLEDGKDYSALEHTFYKPDVVVKIYKEAKAIMVPYSRAADQLKSAFRSWDEMNRFISGLDVSVNNTIDLTLERYAHVLMEGAVITANKHGNVIHLASEYAAYNPSFEWPTEEAAQQTARLRLLYGDLAEDFGRFVARHISKVRRNSKIMSGAYNNHDIATFSQGDNNKLVILGDLADALKFNVRANTYHEDLLGFGDFKTISSWQAIKSATNSKAFNFDTISKINWGADRKILDLGTGNTKVTLSNVVGLAYDKYAVGLCPFRTKTTRSYTGSADFYNFYRHLYVNYGINDGFNMIAFILD